MEFQKMGSRAVALALLVGWAIAVPGYAAPLEQHHSGSVVYITGGVGDSEIGEIKQMMRDYSLSMTFAERQNGNEVFLADVPVTIRNEHGDSVLDVRTDGPYLLVKLPAGSYEISASHNGKTETRKVKVSDHSSVPVAFEWS